MAKRYAFTNKRDVRRALKASRLVLDRREIKPARYAGIIRPEVSQTVINNAGGTCPCGTQYERGSVTLTWDSVDVEFAATYTTDWADFPELTYIGGGVWESDVAVLDTCYGGTRESKLRMTPIEPPSMTAANFVGGAITFAAKIQVVSTTNDCTGVDADLADITAIFISDNFANLATSTFKLPTYTRTGEYQFPCTICVAPKTPSILLDADTVCSIPAAGLPEVVTIDLGVATAVYDYRNPNDLVTCAYYSDITSDCSFETVAVGSVSPSGSYVTFTFLAEYEFTYANRTYYAFGGAVDIPNADYEDFLYGRRAFPITFSGYKTDVGNCFGSTADSFAATIFVSV